MNKKGFSLAEILITLSIISIVSVLVVPMTISINREKQNIELEIAISKVRDRMIYLLRDNSSWWNQTLNHSDNSTAFNCLQTSSSCTNNQQAVVSIFAPGLSYNPATDGFNLKAEQCLQTAEDCIFKIDSFWQAVCPNSASTCPTANVLLKLNFINVDEGNYNINLNANNLEFFDGILTSEDVKPVENRELKRILTPEDQLKELVDPRRVIGFITNCGSTAAATSAQKLTSWKLSSSPHSGNSNIYLSYYFTDSDPDDTIPPSLVRKGAAAGLATSYNLVYDSGAGSMVIKTMGSSMELPDNSGLLFQDPTAPPGNCIHAKFATVNIGKSPTMTFVNGPKSQTVPARLLFST